MRTIYTIIIAVLLFSGASLSLALAEDKKPSTAQIEMLDIKQLEKARKAAEPAEQQSILAALGGKWLFDLNFYSKKGADAQLSNGRVENEMILGGRFLSSKMDLILNVGGESLSYQGLNVIGYDNIKKVYTSTLIDNMRTGIANGEGKYDEKNKTLEIKGRLNHPLFDKERAYRTIIQFFDDNKYTQTIFMADKSGGEFKLIEIEYHRAI